jgi:hypothetical protein
MLDYNYYHIDSPLDESEVRLMEQERYEKQTADISRAMESAINKERKQARFHKAQRLE